MPRSRRRRLIFAAAVVVFVLGAGWRLGTEGEDVRAAKDVTLGMTEYEVRTIIGDDPDVMGIQMRYVGPSYSGLMRGYSYSRWFVTKLWLSRKMGWKITPPIHDDWPVHIRFDASGRVDRIKRGNEIVTAGSAAK
jgi:hypothetical protein